MRLLVKFHVILVGIVKFHTQNKLIKKFKWSNVHLSSVSSVNYLVRLLKSEASGCELLKAKSSLQHARASQSQSLANRQGCQFFYGCICKFYR